MRLVVTPLGGAGRTARQVVGAVVEYLEGGVGDPGAGVLAASAAPSAGPSAGDGLASYYGDSPEGPGRWIGAEWQLITATHNLRKLHRAATT